VLKADKGVAHGRVVNLMERAKQAGLTRLAIGTAGGG
jgi:biopolymer transport protein ExbD